MTKEARMSERESAIEEVIEREASDGHFGTAVRARAELAALRQERDALRATLESRENVPLEIMDDALYVCRAAAEHLRADTDTKDRARCVLEWDECAPRWNPPEARDALRREQA